MSRKRWVLVAGALITCSCNSGTSPGDGGPTLTGRRVGACDGWARADGVESRVCVELFSDEPDLAIAQGRAASDCSLSYRYSGTFRPGESCPADAIATCTMSTSDGGASFRSAFSSTRQLLGFHATSADAMRLVDNSAHVDTTVDGGASWTRSGLEVVNERQITAFAFPSADTGLLVGRVDSAQTTLDGGATWHHTSVPTPLYGADALVFADSARGLALTSSGIYRTTDGGASWAPSASTTGGRQAVFAGPDEAWLIGERGTLHRAKNALD